jgi:uncharacterized protein YciI
MLFALMGFLPERSDRFSPEVQERITQYLAQPLIDIRLAGALLNDGGRRAGMMMLLEAESFSAAQSFLADSPLVEKDLFEEVHLFEYRIEAGQL